MQNLTPSQVLEAVLSSDNNIRKEAEAYLNTLHTTNPLASFEIYVAGLDLPRPDIAEVAAILLKKKHIDRKEDLSQIPQEKLIELVTRLQSTFGMTDRSLNFLKRAADILTLLYFNQEAYLDMLKFTFSLTSSEDPKIKRIVMYFIELLCDFSFDDEIIMEFAKDLVSIFDKYLADPDLTIRTYAIKTTAIFIANISDEKFIKSFSNILAVVLKTLIEAVKADEEIGRTAIESLTDLAETHPKFIKPIVEDSIAIMSEIIEAKGISSSVKSAALMALKIMASTADVVIRKSVNFKNKAIPALMKTMCQVEEVSLDEWNKEVDEMTISKNDPQSIAQESLNYFVGSLGAKFMLMNCFPFIKEMIISNDWKVKYGGLMTLGLLAENSAKYFGNDLDAIMMMIIPCYDSVEPRVIYATLTAVALLCDEFTPKIQEKYHEVILGNIIKYMTHSPHLKVQTQAVSSILNFCKGLVELDDQSDQTKIVSKYADTLLPLLSTLFDKAIKAAYYPLQEESLNAISMIASVIGGEFSKYYNSFMPALQTLIQTLPSENHQQQRLRTLTIETMGFLAAAIKENPGAFLTDLENTLMLLINIHNNPNLPEDDSQREAIINVYPQFASCLKEKFANFLPLIIDNILKSLKIHIDILLQDEISAKNNEAQKKGMVTANVNLSLLGGKNTLSINQGALGQKIAASNAIHGLAKYLGKSYLPYVAKTFEAISALFDYRYSKVIRRNAYKTVHHLVMCCDNEATVSEILNVALPPILKEAKEFAEFGSDSEALAILKSISKSLRYLTTPNLKEDVVVTLINVLGKTINLCDKLKKEVVKDYDELEEIDEEKDEQMKAEFEEVNDLMQIVMHITGNLLKLYKTTIEKNVLSTISPYYYATIKKKEVTENEILYSICLFDDMLEYCSIELFNQAIGEILPLFVNYCQNSKNIDIIQSSVYGLGIVAMRQNKNDFRNIRNDIVTIITSIIMDPQATSEERAACTDAAIGALGRVAIYQGDSSDKLSQEIMIKFLQLLPLKNDPEEAQTMHNIILEGILNKNEMLTANIPDIQNLLLKVINDIKAIESNNPEMEILNDKGKLLLNQMINVA